MLEKKIPVNFKNLDVKDILTFLAGLIGALLIEEIVNISSYLNWFERIIYVLLIIFSLTAITSLVHIRSKIKEMTENKITISADVIQATLDKNGENKLYEEMIRFISSAEECIQVVHIKMPLKYITPAIRDNYFSVLEQTIIERVNAGLDFEYERIIQTEEPKEILSISQTDNRLYEHYEILQSLSEKNPTFQIRLRTMPRIDGQIGFIIVDRRKIFLTIPAVSQKRFGELGAYRHATGIIFQDPFGHLTNQMLKNFRNLRDYSIRVVSIEKNESSDENN